MEIRKRFSESIAILYLAGNIDIDSAPIIEETSKLLNEGVNKILCNFVNVEMVDYNGLSALAIAYKNVTNQSGIIKFCCVSSHIKQLFRIVRLEEIFDVYDSEESAIKAFSLSDKVDKLLLRRRFKRIELSVPILFKPGLSSGDILSKGKMFNISGEGLFIHSKNTFPVSTDLYIEIRLKRSQKPLSVSGTVIWLADKQLQPHVYPGMGVKLTNMDSVTQESVIEFIDENLATKQG
jgi:anti-anti-sigma factor